MANYNIEDVKKLRSKTGARVMDCKEALDKANGDFDKAKDIVAAKGLARAEKKADRVTNAGYIAQYVHNTGTVGALVEIDCETDFVAQNEEFRDMAKNIAMQVVAMKPKDVFELMGQDYIREPDITVENLIKKVSGKIGEKMEVARFVRFEVGESAYTEEKDAEEKV
jgi:elongation factor Ts